MRAKAVLWAWVWRLLAIGAAVPGAVAAEAMPDVPFQQEYREPFVASASPEENDLRAVTVDRQGRVWLATAAGFRYLEGAAFKTPERGAVAGPAYDVEIDAEGTVWGAAWNGLFRLSPERVEPVAGFEQALAEIAVAGDRMAVGGPDGLWIRQGGAWNKSTAPVATSFRDLLWVDNQLWAATAVGAYVVEGDRARRLYRTVDLLSSDVHALCQTGDGRVWVGSNVGLDVFDRGQRVASYTGREGLPSIHVRSLAVDAQDRLWIGTAVGLARYDGRRFAFRHSLRWLPHDEVRDVLALGEHRCCIATAGGLSVLDARPLTLEEKAAHYERVVRARHVRAPGLVEVCYLRVPGDLNTWEPMDTDNDGMYTGQYLASQCFRYAVTRDPVARASAVAGFEAIEFLQTVTSTPGFIARTVIPREWKRMADPNRTYTPAEAAAERIGEPLNKIVTERWRPSSDGRWLWKGDTSSDEISGHYYAWGVFYDLVANESERRRVAALARRVTDQIIAGEYSLRDIDGRSTQWAIWSPSRLNGDPNWAPERNTNSIEIIALLEIAAHLTGDEKYRQHGRDLLDRHGYRHNLLPPQSPDPGLFTFIDSDLLAMDFRDLLCEQALPAWRETFLPSLEAWYRMNRRVHSPFYNFTYGHLSGRECDAAAAVQYLRDVPLDMVRWRIDNSTRDDVQIVRTPQSGSPQTDRWLPPDERALIKWDGNPFHVADGDGGRAEDASTFWLLPYWMGRHYGFIAAPQP
ncbi:MAG: hypothetical protein K1X74_07620 [Pirellulales bacterium]|nr:hypothetical protein [Pirellulales bacterium]